MSEYGRLKSISTDHRQMARCSVQSAGRLRLGVCLLCGGFRMNRMNPLVIAGRAFQSRLIVGTGKYKDGAETQAAIEASGAEMVTVAVRRVNLDRSTESLLDFIDPQRYFLLPNTAGCYTADEAIRAARLGREVGLSDWVKIEVIGDQQTLYPDVQATLEATRVLVKEGFTVLPYTSDDIVFAKTTDRCRGGGGDAAGRADWQRPRACRIQRTCAFCGS